MPVPLLARWAGPLGVTAAVLVLLSQFLRLGVGLTLIADSATTHTLTYAFALLGMFALLLALTSIYLREHTALGRLGLVGYLTASLGTLLVAGDWWFEAFIVPVIAAEAPAVLGLAPAGSILAGAVSTVAVYTAGWVLFGAATLRVTPIPRAAAALLIVGGLLGPLALTTPYQVPLAIAVGWIGVALTRAPAHAREEGHRATSYASA
jgi:hypothetical protein